MNKEHSDYLFNRFSFFRPEGSLRDSLMFFGFECGDGWYDLVLDLCLKIEKELMKEEEKFPFKVIQVKEKFGTLRFYANWETDKISKLIREAEERSSITCETCGEKGESQSDGWIKTLCSSCNKES